MPRRRRRSARSTAPARVASFSARQPYLTLVAPGVGVPSLGRIAGQAYSGEGTSQVDGDRRRPRWRWSGRSYPHAGGARIVARVLATLDARRSRRRAPPTATACSTPTARSPRPCPANAPNPVYARGAPFLARETALRDRRGSAAAPAAGRAAGSTAGPLRGRVGDAAGRARRCSPAPALALAGLLLLVVLRSCCVVAAAGRPVLDVALPPWPTPARGRCVPSLPVGRRPVPAECRSRPPPAPAAVDAATSRRRCGAGRSPACPAAPPDAGRAAATPGPGARPRPGPGCERGGQRVAPAPRG